MSGELDIATSPQLERVLEQARQDARLVLLNLHAVSFMDCSAVHVIVAASDRARQTGGRLFVAGAPPQAHQLFVLTGTDVDVEFLRHEPSPPVEQTRRGPATNGQRHERRHIRPLANPVNARVMAARVMAMPDRGLWLHASDDRLHRAWAPEAAGLHVPAGTRIEIYLDGRGNVNGWRDPESGLAINQRRLHRDVATAQALACQGPCGVVWRAPAADELTEHDERCLTCAGALALS